MTSLGPTVVVPDTMTFDEYGQENDAYARASRQVTAPSRFRSTHSRSSAPMTSGSVWHLLRSYPKFAEFASVLEKAGVHSRLDDEKSKHIVFVPEHVNRAYFSADYLLTAAHIIPLNTSLEYVRKNLDLKYPSLYAPSHTIKFNVRGSDGTLVVNGTHDVLQHIPASNGAILVVAREIVPDVIF